MLTTLTLIAVVTFAAPEDESPLQFERIKLGDAVFEAGSVADVDNNGTLDVIVGGAWFEGPDFKTEHKICDVPYQHEYHDDFGDYPVDVNGDGYPDVITGGWFGESIRWRENPGKKGFEWVTHDIFKTGNIERLSAFDIDADGFDEFFTTTFPVHFFKLVRDKDGKGTGKFEHHTISMGNGGHGFGAGDVNGDGRMDLVLAGGWLEAPEDPFDTEAWTWHQEFDLGSASVELPVYDVNGDGLNDLIVGGAHGYGLFWYEQGKSLLGKRTWTQHSFEPNRSQFHDVQLHDIDNDGEVEIITGKRHRAHNGNDPGGDDPVGLYYYEINGGDFRRVTIDYGPKETASGAGIYFWVQDVDGNGWKDIVAPGKEGCYLFKNLGPLAKQAKN